METKFVVFDKLKVFKTLVENQIEKKIKMIWCDGGGELNFKNFNVFCKENGIVKWTTTPYTLKQNGVIERKNWTLVENVWCMLQHMKLDHKL
jgi:isoleucyl-tRNA synthetase